MNWHCPDCGHENDTAKRCSECHYRRPDPDPTARVIELPDPASVELLREQPRRATVGRVIGREGDLADALLDVAMADQVAWTHDEIDALVSQLEASTDRVSDWLDIRT